MLELHETVENETGEMVMRQIEGGFTIPAGGSLALEPGGNHIMLMDLTSPLMAGDEVTFTLTFADDTTYEVTAPVKVNKPPPTFMMPFVVNPPAIVPAAPV